MLDSVDFIVAGAGVVGLAIARALAMEGREVIVLEATDAIGQGISARNSEVIHAGIYYPPGSLKARMCREGNRALYRFCKTRNIPHRRIEKLVVATTSAQRDALRQLENNARLNGVTDLVMLNSAEAKALEPNLACVAALRSPSTGIIDSHQLMLALQADCEAHGGVIAFRSRLVAGAQADRAGWLVTVRDADGQRYNLSCKGLVNAAGLGAQEIANSLDGMPGRLIPELFFSKGSYFQLTGAAPFSRLIYPVPGQQSLGIHATPDMTGRVRFGPDHQWIDALDYSVSPDQAGDFYTAIRNYYPGLADGSLEPGFAGIRPKIQVQAVADFMIQTSKDHGLGGLINLFGIESPGLTAALPIADYVADIALK